MRPKALLALAAWPAKRSRGERWDGGAPLRPDAAAPPVRRSGRGPWCPHMPHRRDDAGGPWGPRTPRRRRDAVGEAAEATPLQAAPLPPPPSRRTCEPGLPRRRPSTLCGGQVHRRGPKAQRMGGCTRPDRPMLNLSQTEICCFGHFLAISGERPVNIDLIRFKADQIRPDSDQFGPDVA